MSVAKKLLAGQMWAVQPLPCGELKMAVDGDFQHPQQGLGVLSDYAGQRAWRS